MKWFSACALILFVSQYQTVVAETTDETSDSAQEPAQMKFPSWPERHRHYIPDTDFVPPPPGPYMSNALSAIANGFGEEGAAARPSDEEFFKPDMSWPERRFAPPPTRWMPEEGYRFAPPDAATTQTPLAKQGMSQNPVNPGYSQMRPPYYGWGPRQPQGVGQYYAPPQNGH